MTGKEEKQICRKLESELATAIKEAADFLPEDAYLYWALRNLADHRTEIEATRKRETNYLPDPGFFK